MDLTELRHHHFADRIGDQFTATLPDGSAVALELSSATEPSEPRPDHAHFAEWVGPTDQPLAQGLYNLNHDGLGELTLFLVPINRVERGFVYEAVFTRLDR